MELAVLAEIAGRHDREQLGGLYPHIRDMSVKQCSEASRQIGEKSLFGRAKISAGKSSRRHIPAKVQTSSTHQRQLFRICATCRCERENEHKRSFRVQTAWADSPGGSVGQPSTWATTSNVEVDQRLTPLRGNCRDEEKRREREARSQRGGEGRREWKSEGGPGTLSSVGVAQFGFLVYPRPPSS